MHAVAFVQVEQSGQASLEGARNLNFSHAAPCRRHNVQQRRALTILHHDPQLICMCERAVIHDNVGAVALFQELNLALQL